MLHDISVRCPIHLIVSKTRLKKDINQRFFRDTRNVDIIAFYRYLNEASDSLSMQ